MQTIQRQLNEISKKKKKNTKYIIQDIVHPNRIDADFNTAGQIGFFWDSRTVTVVRFPIEERRVETECAERAFERSSVNPRKRERVRLGDPRIQDLLLIKGDSEGKKQRAERPSAPKDVNGFDFSGERWRVKNFNPMKGKREDGSLMSAPVILAQGQSVHPLVAGACELALWAVAFGFFLSLRVLNFHFNVFYSFLKVIFYLWFSSIWKKVRLSYIRSSSAITYDIL
jgi:hypothetical protein